MSSKPPIPKRFAAKIRGAQSKVTALRGRILSYEDRIRHESKRVAEYEADPVLFASKHYEGNSVDSYPVQTNIARSRDALIYHRAEVRRMVMELAESEENVRCIEESVGNEISHMKPSSGGRVCWPAPLASFDKFKTAWVAEMNQISEDYEIRRAAELAEIEAATRIEDDAYKEGRRLEDDAFINEWSVKLAQMTPDQRADALQAFGRLKDAVEMGEISVMQIISILESDQKST